jgi:GH15 family glucan-1,4-alpha-glucosidase
MARLIEDYGLIGDGETAALVSKEGSIDWLCWPRFDSDACFAALLGTADHGSWKIAARDPHQTKRRYQPDTLVLETDQITDDGAIRITDFMPIRNEVSVVVRSVSGLAGRVRICSELNLQFDYGSVSPWIEIEGRTAIARVGPDFVSFRSPVDIDLHGGTVVSEAEVREGDELHFVLSYQSNPHHRKLHLDPHKLLDATQRHWRDWIGRFERQTDWPDAVRRSLITLKALIYRPSGGIVAAPTTSLPEAPSGEMNWDYRYCWLRDSTFTLAAMLNAGFHEEAVAWRDWLLRAVAGAPEKMRIMYRLDGMRRLEEWIPNWLPGFRWSPPVRVGNAAAQQLQLDVFGEVLDTLHLAARGGIKPSQQALKLQDAIVQHVAAIWRHPDHGLWELRGKPRHYVYSKVSAWVAIDRYVTGETTAERLDHSALEGMQSLRNSMHEEICREGFDQGLGTFVSHYGSQSLDASLLLLPIVKFLPARDERMSRTIAAIERDLVEDGLVRRWRPDSETSEGAFLACTCWLADCQALQGRDQDARATFERFLAVRNDLGLLAEEYDTRAHHLAGNFPQALSHLALVQTALALCGPTEGRGDHVH